ALREAPSGGRGYTHPPSDCLAIDFPGRGLHFFSPAPTLRTPRRAICPSARSLSQPLSLQGAGFVDLLLRAWTSTAYLRIRWIWCARSASKGDQQPSHPSFFPSAQIRAFDAENNFERERDGPETDADQNSPADRGVEHIENPLGDIAAQWKQILPEWYPAHHDDHRCHQQHGGLAASGPERPVRRRGDEECQNGEHRALQRHHHEAIDPTEPRHGAVATLFAPGHGPGGDRHEHAAIEHEAVSPPGFLPANLDGVLMEQTRTAGHQGKAADDLQPLRGRGQQKFGRRMRDIVLPGEQKPRDHRDQQREPAAEKDHFRSLTRSRNSCGHEPPVATPTVASRVPIRITLRITALPMSWPRSVPI